jgi:Rho guanine nucleotide exchange factor 12
LGTKKKSEKDLPTSNSGNLDSSLQSEVHSITPTKNKRHNFNSDKKGDIPPPLPQRNILRKSLNHSVDDTDIADAKNCKRNTPISDLDQSVISEGSKSSSNMVLHTGLSSSSSLTSSSVIKSKKRAKNKTKALSDPKMNSQTFLQMESGRDFCSEPPPLPPRHLGLNDPANSNSQFSSPVSDTNNRPLPNSINTLMNYPLVATVTATVRDNISAAYPLSQRPNIVQQLQHQQQQQQQHQQQQNIQQYNFHSNSKSPVSKKNTKHTYFNSTEWQFSNVFWFSSYFCIKFHHSI